MPRTLTKKQELEMAIAVGRGDHPKDVADIVGCSIKTVIRRMDDAEFMAVVEQTKAEAYRDLPNLFRDAVGDAFRTILELAQSADRDSTRLTASKMLLDYAGVQPIPQDPDGGGGVSEPDVYAYRDADGVYRPIKFLPSGRVDLEAAESGT